METHAEYVIASIIRDGYQSYIDCSEIIDADSFDNMRDSVIWTVFKNIYEGNNPPKKVSGADFLAVARSLNYASEIKDNVKFMQELKLLETDSQSTIRAAKIVKKNQIKRDLQLKMQIAMKSLESINIDGSTSIESIISSVETPIFEYINNLNIDGNQIKKMAEGAREHIYDLLGNPREFVGIPSFCMEWNSAVGGGFRPGLDLRSARRKAGKSTISINDIKFIAGKDLRIPILYLDKEMPLEAGQLRMTSSLSKTPTYMIEQGRIDPGSPKHTQIVKALTEFEEMPVWYANVSGVAFDDMLAMIRRWLIRSVGYGDDGRIKPCLVIYDYIKLADGKELKHADEYQLIGFQATALTNIGLKYNIPISTYVQSNQEGKVAQSDRLSWLCNALSYFVVADDDEILANNNKWNRKFIVDCCRFGPGLGPQDFIAMKLDGQYADIKVLGLNSKLANIGKLDDDATF